MLARAKGTSVGGLVESGVVGQHGQQPAPAALGRDAARLDARQRYACAGVGSVAPTDPCVESGCANPLLVDYWRTCTSPPLTIARWPTAFTPSANEGGGPKKRVPTTNWLRRGGIELAAADAGSAVSKGQLDY